MLNRVTIAASNCANAELSPVVFFVSVFIANTVGLYNIWIFFVLVKNVKVKFESHKNLKFAFKGEESLAVTKEQM